MDFEKTCMMFTMQEPFYGILLSSMTREVNKKIGTIGVSRSGNVFKLLYNPEFIDTLTVDTVLQILKHECMHVAFNHFTIWDDQKTENDSAFLHKLRNIAEDLEINCFIDRSKVCKEAGDCFVEDFNFDKDLGTREYLRKLLDMFKYDPQSNNNYGSGGDNGDESGDGSGKPGNNQNQNQNINKKQFDNHDLWPRDLTENEKQLIKEQVENLLIMAAEETEKSRGTIPGEMKIKIDKIKANKKARPVADWKRYTRRYLGNEFSEFMRKSKKRESKRFPDAPGNRHRRKSHILVAIDTSGSVSMPEYIEFFRQINTIKDHATFHVVECDAKIQHEYEFTGKPNMTLRGGGGTSFQPPVDLFNKNKKFYDALVYFTDGGAPIPDDTPKDTLWVISSKGDQSERKRYRVNGASVAFIKSNQ